MEISHQPEPDVGVSREEPPETGVTLPHAYDYRRRSLQVLSSGDLRSRRGMSRHRSQNDLRHSVSADSLSASSAPRSPLSSIPQSNSAEALAVVESQQTADVPSLSMSPPLSPSPSPSPTSSPATSDGCVSSPSSAPSAVPQSSSTVGSVIPGSSATAHVTTRRHHGPMPSKPLPPPPPGSQHSQQQQQQQSANGGYRTKVEAPDLEMDVFGSGKMCIALCSLEQLLRCLCGVVYTKDTSQIAYFVLTYDYFTNLDDTVAIMNSMYFDEGLRVEDRSLLRIALLSIMKTWVHLNSRLVLNHAGFMRTVQRFLSQEDPAIGYHPSAWALMHAIYARGLGREEIAELHSTMLNKETGILLPTQGHRSHFTGQEFFDWMQDVAGLERGDALATAYAMESEGLIKSAFKTEGFTASAHVYFPGFTSLMPSEVSELLPILEISPVDLAEQLCLHEHTLFRAIRLEELKRSAWTKSSKDRLSPNVMAMIHFSNKISYWIATEIVSNPNPKRRVDVLRRAIIMASTCMQLNCYSGVMEILAGLQHTSVRRLRSTWAALPYRYREMLHDALVLMSPDDNSKAYRECLRSRFASLTSPSPDQQSITGVVPHLGQYLTDITFIDTANSDTNQARGLINFRKMRMLGAVLHEMRVFQQSQYTLRYRDEIQKVLIHSTLCPASDEELHTMARFIESADNQFNADQPPLPAGTKQWKDSDKLQDILESLPEAKEKDPPKK